LVSLCTTRPDLHMQLREEVRALSDEVEALKRKK
jgi:hypothetical protein